MLTETSPEILAFLKQLKDRDLASNATEELKRMRPNGYQDFHALPGKKFLKIVSLDAGKNPANLGKEPLGMSCMGFIDKETGDIYKSASWAARANGIRGNVFKNEGQEALTPMGRMPFIRYAH